MALGEDIVMFRAKNNMTQGEFAQLCSLSKKTIISIEQNTCRPSKRTLAKIHLVLNGGVYETEHFKD